MKHFLTIGYVVEGKKPMQIRMFRPDVYNKRDKGSPLSNVPGGGVLDMDKNRLVLPNKTEQPRKPEETPDQKAAAAAVAAQQAAAKKVADAKKQAAAERQQRSAKRAARKAARQRTKAEKKIEKRAEVRQRLTGEEPTDTEESFFYAAGSSLRELISEAKRLTGAERAARRRGRGTPEAATRAKSAPRPTQPPATGAAQAARTAQGASKEVKQVPGSPRSPVSQSRQWDKLSQAAQEYGKLTGQGATGKIPEEPEPETKAEKPETKAEKPETKAEKRKRGIDPITGKERTKESENVPRTAQVARGVFRRRSMAGTAVDKKVQSDVEASREKEAAKRTGKRDRQAAIAAAAGEPPTPNRRPKTKKSTVPASASGGAGGMDSERRPAAAKPPKTEDFSNILYRLQHLSL
jgi:hypothetical protein